MPRGQAAHRLSHLEGGTQIMGRDATLKLPNRLIGGRFYGENSIRRKLRQARVPTGLRGLTGFGSAPVVIRRVMQPPGTSRVSDV